MITFFVQLNRPTHTISIVKHNRSLNALVRVINQKLIRVFTKKYSEIWSLQSTQSVCLRLRTHTAEWKDILVHVVNSDHRNNSVKFEKDLLFCFWVFRKNSWASLPIEINGNKFYSNFLQWNFPKNMYTFC